MRTIAAILALAAVTACGDDGQSTLVEKAEYHAEAKGRVVVAKVDGEPIYDDCVATQAEAKGIDRHAALDECIGFELLALEARRRGYLENDEVLETRKREAVRALIDDEFMGAFASPDDLPEADIRQLWDQSQPRYNHPENRSTNYCRANVRKKEPRGGEVDLAAKAAADEVHRRLAGRKEITLEEFFDVCREVDGVDPGPDKPFGFPRHGRAVEEFAAAAFDIPEPGMVSKVVRTRWGWDIIRLNRILPPKTTTFAEAAPELREMLYTRPELAPYRRQLFTKWAVGYEKQHDIEVNESQIARLADDPLDELGLQGEP